METLMRRVEMVEGMRVRARFVMLMVAIGDFYFVDILCVFVDSSS